MNKYLKELNKIEFVITYACTGRCKHCSEGDHSLCGEHIDPLAAAKAVRDICAGFPIQTVMTFGGEPLLYADAVCSIHTAASDMGVPKRQLITNGYFSKDSGYIAEVAARLAESRVNDVRLSVDAFHQETIPLSTVKAFAQAALSAGLPLRTQPAWLVSPHADNPYNQSTKAILAQFAAMGIKESGGNVIFSKGNALKHLKDYFTADAIVADPYEEDPYNVKTASVEPNGNLLGGNIYRGEVMEILKNYTPDKLSV